MRSRPEIECGDLESGEGEHGGGEVGGDDHAVGGLATGLAWVVEEAGNAQRGFVHQPLSGEAVFAAEVAVVGGEEDDGVVGESAFLEFVHDAADAEVHAGDGAVVVADVRSWRLGSLRRPGRLGQPRDFLMISGSRWALAWVAEAGMGMSRPSVSVLEIRIPVGEGAVGGLEEEEQEEGFCGIAAVEEAGDMARGDGRSRRGADR